LRQLNNNPRYSKDYAAGGKRAAQSNGEKKVPRLIVEFAVENKAKAKQQSDRRARQLVNASNQKIAKASNDRKADSNKSAKKKKMSRGALQREKKRKLKEEKLHESPAAVTQKLEEQKTQTPDKPKVKMSKPLKRQKIDIEEKAFESMVERYKSKFMGNVIPLEKEQKKLSDRERGVINKRRWFE